MLALRVVAQQFLRASQCLHALLEIAPPPLILVERDDRPEIGIGEPLELLGEMRLGVAQRLATGEQFLRQPRPAMGACDGCGEWLRLLQQGAEIVPDHLVELAGGDIESVRRWGVPAGAGQDATLR